MIETDKLLKLRQDDVFFMERVNKIAKVMCENKTIYEGLFENYIPKEAEEILMSDIEEYKDKVFILAISHITFEIMDSPTLSGGEMIDESITIFHRYLKLIEIYPEHDYMKLVEGWKKFWE